MANKLVKMQKLQTWSVVKKGKDKEGTIFFKNDPSGFAR